MAPDPTKTAPAPDPKPEEAAKEGDKPIDFKKQNEEQRIAAVRTAKANVQEKIEAISKTLGDGLPGLIRDVMADIITGSAASEISKLWEKAAEDFAKKNPDKLKELPEITRPYLEKLQEMEAMAIRYIEVLTSVAEGGQATPEALLRMRDSQNAKAITLAKILTDTTNTAAQEAVKYVFKMKSQTNEEFGKLSSYLSQVFDKRYIEQCLAQGQEFSSAESPIGWFIITFLPDTGDKSKESVIKDIRKKYALTDAQLKAFLKAGISSGAISVSLASKFTEFQEKEEKELAVAYKIQNDFLQKARQIATPPYGSTNPALEMLNLRNILLLVAQVAAGVSVGGTILAGIFKGGALKSPDKLLETLSSKTVLIGTGVWTAAHYLKHPKPGILTSKEERETSQKRETARDLTVVLNSNRGWNELLTQNGHKGGEIFGEFVLQYCMKGEKDKILDEPDATKVNLASFKKWLLERQKQIGGSRKGKYSQLADKITGSEKEGFRIAGTKVNWETNNDDFKRLADAFFVWKIGGAQTATQFNSALRMAQSTVEAPVKPKEA